MILEKFKSPPFAVAVLILVLCQTWSMSTAAPSLPLPVNSYHFHSRGVSLPAKRSPDKGPPPAAAADWTATVNLQQVDIDVADLEKLKEPTLHNYELELKQDDDKWHAVEEPTRDELADELRKLEVGPSTEGSSTGGGVKGDGGQLEQDDTASYYNARQHEAGEDLPQPTQIEMQREQQQIDDEIRGENHKDSVGSMETPRSAHQNHRNDELLHSHDHIRSTPTHTIPNGNAKAHSATLVKPPQLPTSAPHTASIQESMASEQTTNSSVPHPDTSTDDLPPVNQQEEQRDLLEDTPQQNEDIYNLFTNNGNRRSVKPPSLSVVGHAPELRMTKATLLKGRNGGQFSSHDLAQYVFWTGDEAGVAQAIEDLIEGGLMSRENAIIFLREIHTHIEYLQNAYAGNGPLQLSPTVSQEKAKPMAVTPMKLARQIPRTTLQSLFIATPPSNDALDLGWKSHQGSERSSSSNSLENVPVLMKLNQMVHSRDEDQQQSNAVVSDIDDTNGRLRLADYLYAEYTLEEVIYELAKVMFSQALLKGSGQAQEALQKFIAFVEVEASEGRISPGLQTKVIDVLMKALSDTMAEHPELLAMAKAYLGKSMNHLNNNNQLF